MLKIYTKSWSGWAKACLGLCGLVSVAVQASEPAAPLVMYIQSQEYQHPIKLWQYFRDFWYAQGPYVERAAQDVLSQQFGSVHTCHSDQNDGKVLVWLRPRMFYNPQTLTFHGKITAVAYTSDGKLIDTYVGEANKLGFLDVKPDLQLDEVYRSTMLEVSKAMQSDEKFQTAINAVSASSVNTPCAMVGTLPEPKIQFMSF